MAIERFDIPQASDRCFWAGANGSDVVLADQEASLEHVLSLATWPPKVTTLNDACPLAVDWSRDGSRLCLFSTNVDDAAYGVRLHTPKGSTDLPRFADERRYGFLWAGFVGARIVVWPGPRHPFPRELPAAEWRPLSWNGEAWLEEQSLPSIPADANAEPLLGTVKVHNGADVLVWLGNGYELKNGRFEQTFAMGALASRAEWSTAPAGGDGFFYLSNRALFEIHPGSTPKPHLAAEELTNIIKIAPGPNGQLLLRLGKNAHNAMAAIYDPQSGKTAFLTAEMLGQKRIEGLCWSESAGRLLAIAKTRITALPAAELPKP
jgi:hypothetical protein